MVLSAQSSRTPQVDKNGQPEKRGNGADTTGEGPSATEHREHPDQGNHPNRKQAPAESVGLELELLPVNQ
jgi:hypothetical protein